MKTITREWADKAEGDFAIAEREVEVKLHPNYDAVCFHCQQCAEKYLKARLQEADIYFGKTHDLSALLDILLAIEPAWDSLRPDLQTLTQFAVSYRYPGDSADETEAREAVAKCKNVRAIVRKALGM
jgi:HEPN domain-containing protein